MTTTPAHHDDAPHQALYRRWRAQTFAEIVGQAAVVETLRNAVRSDRVSHAILFVGPRGTGKTSLARILAKALNCTNLQDGDPCDRCEACVAIREGRALDLVEIDAASNRGIDDIRDLRERINYAPTDLRRKVYILDEAHQITKDAWNALLKSLEEPPDFVDVHVRVDPPPGLPAGDPVAPPAVRRPPPDRRPRSRASSGGSSPPRASRPSRPPIHLIARLAAGGMRDAESMLDQLLVRVRRHDRPKPASATCSAWPTPRRSTDSCGPRRRRRGGRDRRSSTSSRTAAGTSASSSTRWSSSSGRRLATSLGGDAGAAETARPDPRRPAPRRDRPGAARRRRAAPPGRARALRAPRSAPVAAHAEQPARPTRACHRRRRRPAPTPAAAPRCRTPRRRRRDRQPRRRSRRRRPAAEPPRAAGAAEPPPATDAAGPATPARRDGTPPRRRRPTPARAPATRDPPSDARRRQRRADRAERQPRPRPARRELARDRRLGPARRPGRSSPSAARWRSTATSSPSASRRPRRSSRTSPSESAATSRTAVGGFLGRAVAVRCVATNLDLVAAARDRRRGRPDLRRGAADLRRRPGRRRRGQLTGRGARRTGRIRQTQRRWTTRRGGRPWAWPTCSGWPSRCSRRCCASRASSRR